MDNQLGLRLDSIRKQITDACVRSGRDKNSVRLIAVTKTHPAETLQALIDLGVKDIGENRVQEIEQKIPQLKGEFEIHMIGHLQTNKVSHVIPFIKWVHSIDRERLIKKIEQHHSGTGKIKALVEVNTSNETSKSGCQPDETRMICERIVSSPALEFCGLMTIGPLGGNEKKTRDSFSLLRKLAQNCSDLAEKIELSMGMSGDFEWAIEEGATMVRIGSLLVGNRNYK